MNAQPHAVMDFDHPPPQRGIAEQLSSLSESEKAAFAHLKTLWGDDLSDSILLKLLRGSPGRLKFNSESTAKLNMGPVIQLHQVQRQLETGTFVWTGGKNKEGFAQLYMRPALFSPNYDSLQELIKSLVYMLQCMTDEEHTAVWGLSFFVDLQGWGWKHFGVHYAKVVLDTLQGGYPCRIIQCIIYNAPPWFGAIWRIIKPMMSAEFAAMVVFVYGDDVLNYYSSVNHVPDAVGGKLDLKHQLTKFVEYRHRVEGNDGT